jgi:AcrR family transcriptional regulator
MAAPRTPAGKPTDMRVSGPPISDPAAELPPTAKRVLAAARRVLERDGFAGLTLEAVQAESGENKAAVWYYFGGKRGLIIALADSIEQEDTKRLLEGFARGDLGDDRLERFIGVQHDGILRDDYRVFWELLPHMVRDPEMRKKLARLLEWYREVDRRALAPEGVDPDDATLRRLAMLTNAVSDGLGLQLTADPSVDLDGALELWRRLIAAVLVEIEAGGGPLTST